MKGMRAPLLAGSCLLFLGAGCATSPFAFSDGDTVPSAQNLNEASETSEQTQALPAMTQTWTFQGTLPEERIVNKQARITTAKGDIVFELLPDVAPITVSNFVYLAEGGFYDGLTFHRREEGFVIQGGDPKGNGTGGPGYTIPAEFNEVKHDRGMVAMARSQHPDSAGSQFYITLGPAYFLDKNYTVFGRVLEGMDVVDQVVLGEPIISVRIESIEE